MREKILSCRPGMGETTDVVMAAIVRPGIREGVRVVTALNDKAVVVMTSREKADIWQDIMEDLGRMVSVRVNRRGWMAGEVDDGVAEVIKAALPVAAGTKAAVIDGSLDVMIHGGTPLLAPDQRIFAVDYRGGEEVELAILCG